MTPRLFATALASVAIAIAAFGGPAAPRALAGSKPHLARVDPAASMAGGVIEIGGTNFSEKPEEIEALFGGEKAYILEAAPERLKILLPMGMKEGTYQLELVVNGERSNKVDIRIRPESERERKAKEDVGKFEQPGGARLGEMKIIQLDAPDPSLDRGVFMVRVSGQAALPDDCIVKLNLKLGNESVVANADAKTSGGRFYGAFGPYTRELFAGHYWVEAVFEAQAQGKRVRDAMKRFYKDPIELAARERCTDRQACKIGTTEQEDAQNKELRSHLAQSLARTRSLARDLEMCYAGAGRSAFRPDGKKVDEAEWEAWLAKRTLKSVAEADRPRRIEEIRAKGLKFLAKDGSFADAKWREWLDHKFRAEAYELARGHAAFKDRYLVVKYADAMADLGDLFGLLGKLAQNRSRELYERNALPVPAQDAEGADMDVLKFGGGKVTLGSIEQGVKKIARDVGLTPAEEKAAEEVLKKNEQQEG